MRDVVQPFFRCVAAVQFKVSSGVFVTILVENCVKGIFSPNVSLRSQPLVLPFPQDFREVGNIYRQPN